MPDSPLISFGIPAYNRPALLGEALASIAAQTAAAECEVVVCDDGALEENRRLTEAFPGGRGRYAANRPALGAVGNWNRCLQSARGRWVMVLHEDDALYPWYLAAVLPRLRDGLAAVCTQTVQGPAPPVLPPPAAGPAVWNYPPRYFLKSSMTPFPGVLVRRDLAAALGGFDPIWGPLADYEFWYRLACAGPVEVVRARAAFYRVSPGQWTEQTWSRMLRLTHLMRLRIAREQFASSPRLGRWLARFFTYRNARSYAGRFPEKPADLARALRLGSIPLAGLPSGWVWAGLKRLARTGVSLLALAAALDFARAAPAPVRVVSQTVGTDELLLDLADPPQIAALSQIAHDPDFSAVARRAQAYPMLAPNADAESVLQYRPTLVLCADYSRPELVAQLRRAGSDVLIFDHYVTPADVYANLRLLGDRLGHRPRAERIVEDCEARTAELRRRLRGLRPVRVIAPSTYDLIAGSGTTFQDSCDHAGAENLAATLGHLVGYRPPPEEQMLLWPVEMVVVSGRDLPSALAPFRSLPPYQYLAAVREGRAVVLPPWVLSCVSHYRVRGYEILARQLHPEAFR